MAESAQDALAEGPAGTVPEAESGVADARRKWSPQRIAIARHRAIVVVWLVIKAVDDPRGFAVVTLNGITLAALYFVVASGFTLIFGLMRVVNMAHGSLYLLGGYLALEMQEHWFKQTAGGDSARALAPRRATRPTRCSGWVIPLLIATGIIGVIGVLIQQVFLRWNQGQDLRQALITIALSVIIADQMLAAFGGISKDIKTPTDWPDSINVLRRPLRLLPRRGRARLGAADRGRAVVADQADALRQDRARRRRRPRHGLRARHQRPARSSRSRSCSARCSPASAACSAAR